MRRHERNSYTEHNNIIYTMKHMYLNIQNAAKVF